MRRSQKLSGLLKDLVALLDEEAERNAEFGARLDALLAGVRDGPPARELKQRRDRSSAPSPDVFAVLESQGPEELRFSLRSLDLRTLRQIVKTNGFDASRASQKWSDPDKFINLIVEQATARLRRGSGFLPPATGRAPMDGKKYGIAERRRDAEAALRYAGAALYKIKSTSRIHGTPSTGFGLSAAKPHLSDHADAALLRSRVDEVERWARSYGHPTQRLSALTPPAGSDSRGWNFAEAWEGKAADLFRTVQAAVRMTCADVLTDVAREPWFEYDPNLYEGT